MSQKKQPKEISEVKQQKDVLFTSTEPTNIEQWYNDIREHTFETKIIPLSPKQAKAIEATGEYFRMYVRHQVDTGEKHGEGVDRFYNDEQLTDALDSNCDWKWGESFHWRKALSSDKNDLEFMTHLQHLTALSESIDSAISEMKCDDGIFVKLSRRSPKDVSLASISMYGRFHKELMEWKERNDRNGVKQFEKHQIVNSFYHASIDSLCVRSGDEAIELLCRSHRIWSDLTMALLTQGKGLRVSVVIRKWNSRLDSNWEFRLFVRNRMPTALTQYNHLIVLPWMYFLKDEIERRILEKYEEVKPLLSRKLEYFTIDFGVILREEHRKRVNFEEVGDEKGSEVAVDVIEDVVVIEVNPGPPIAGTALFDWGSVEDKKILNGEGKFETRISKGVDDVDLTDLDAILPDQAIHFVGLLQKETSNGRCVVL